jgi:AcrR family transcriptional regulator
MTTASGTEEVILKSAETVFYRHGFDGARMQEIADLAGINKALVHYYYRSKERLFDAVFVSAIRRLMPPLAGVLNSDLSVEEKVAEFVDAWFRTVSANPSIPGFVILEMHRNPAIFRKIAGQKGVFDLEKLQGQLETGAAEGRYREMGPEQLIINLLAFCAFPFLARHALQAFGAIDDAAYRQLIDERRRLIPAWTMAMLSSGTSGESGTRSASQGGKS